MAKTYVRGARVGINDTAERKAGEGGNKMRKVACPPFPPPATILAGTLEESYGRGSHWTPKLTYSYSVGGKTYAGHYLTFPERRGSGARAQATLKRYPVGHTVTAYYNPDDPAQSCLVPGPDWWFLFIIPFATVLLLAGGIWLGIMGLRGMMPHNTVQRNRSSRSTRSMRGPGR